LDRIGRGPDDAGADASPLVLEGIFVGRQRELVELLTALDDALAGHGRLVLLSGEPGIGKTRLAEELADRAASRGADVLPGRCWEAGGAPAYWPWVQALRTFLRSMEPEVARARIGAGASYLAQMLPEVRDLVPDAAEPSAADPDSARFRLFDATATFLANAAAETPVVLFLEDLHAADTPSLLLLRFLAAQLATMPVLVVGTYRDVEVTPDHPLTSTVSELARETATRRIALRGLREDEVASFVEAVGGIEVERSLAAALRRQTNGNPLFLGESVRLLIADGITDAAGALTVGTAIPSGIREAIARRLSGVSERTGGCLSAASILGSEFALDALGQLADLQGRDVLDALDEAMSAGLVREVRGTVGRFRFSHDLIREVLYRDLPAGNRVRMHRRAGEVLERLHAGDLDDHLAEIAHHFFLGAAAGGASQAAAFAARAGDRGVAALAYEEAARLYRMAVDALEAGAATDERELAEMLVRLGDARTRAGDLPGSRETFLRAAELARRTGAATVLARAALGYGGRFAWVRAGNDVQMVDLLQDALVFLGGGDDALRVRLLGRLSCALRGTGDVERCDALSQQALDIARTLDDEATLAYALLARYGAIWWPDTADERLELARELRAVAERTRDQERLVEARIGMYVALAELGRTAEARVEIDAIDITARELRQPPQLWLAMGTRAQVAIARGDFDAAEELIERCLGLQPVTLIRDNVSTARFQLWQLRREQDRVEETEADVRASIVEFPWYPMFRAVLMLVLADTHRREEATALFEEMARDDFAAVPWDNYWLITMSLLAEACAALGDAARAERLYELLLPFESRNPTAAPEGWIGVVDRCLGLLASTLGRADAADEHLGEAVRLNTEIEARVAAAHAELEHAEVLLARDGPGDRERAVGLLERSLTTAREGSMTALGDRVRSALASIGEPAPGRRRPAPVPNAAVFRREGEYVTVVFEGDAFRLRDSKGLRFLAVLLGSPGREFHVLDLVAAEGGVSRSAARIEVGALEGSGLGDAGEVLDERAREEYRRRLVELEEEIEEAEAFGDPERGSKAVQEREFLARELASAMGIGGRSRVSGSAAERARVNVTRAIRSALGRIAEHSPGLRDHLEATIRTGGFCSYTPDPGVRRVWQL
jgi:tetratricopeptide (TPR) repeat protein